MLQESKEKNKEICSVHSAPISKEVIKFEENFLKTLR